MRRWESSLEVFLRVCRQWAVGVAASGRVGLGRLRLGGEVGGVEGLLWVASRFEPPLPARQKSGMGGGQGVVPSLDHRGVLDLLSLGNILSFHSSLVFISFRFLSAPS